MQFMPEGKEHPESVFYRPRPCRAILHSTNSNYKTVYSLSASTFVRKRSSGQIFAFGLNNYHQLGIKKKESDALFTPQLTPFTNVKSIVGGQHHTLVLTNDNKCFAIGRKEYGRLGLGNVEAEVVDTLTPITALDKLSVIDLECGESCSFAILEDGKSPKNITTNQNGILLKSLFTHRKSIQLGHGLKSAAWHRQR